MTRLIERKLQRSEPPALTPSDIVFPPCHFSLSLQAFNYVLPEPGEEEIVTSELWSARPTNRSCRGLALSEDAKLLFSVGKERSLQ